MFSMRNIYDVAIRNARVAPQNIALLSPTSTFSNRQLIEAVDSMAVRLFNAGLRNGQIALTQLEPELDWIVTLALAKLGLTSGSVLDFPNSLKELDPWFITSRKLGPTQSNVRAICLDEQWLEPSQMSASALETHVFDVNQGFRILMTSGTTGEPKAALYRYGAIETKLDLLQTHWHGPSREFNMMGLVSVGGFATALACLESGHPYIVGTATGVDLISFLDESGVETLSGSPFQIAQLVTLLTRNQRVMSKVKTIRLAGSTPSSDLVEQVLEDFEVRLTSVYGSTECGGIFVQDLNHRTPSNSLGALLPFAQAIVVDEEGRELPEGKAGILATKSEAMFSGYLTGEGLQKNNNVGGWFFSGDRAVKSQGVFMLLGRESDVLNVGGVKLDATPLDAWALRFPGVAEAVSFETTGQFGRPMLAMAYVAEGEVNSNELSKYLIDRFPHGAPQVLGQVNKIPRTAMGKPIRGELGKLFRDLLLN
jgi:acyl-coenzyme A synthetase/AMP-(fatty) acid ligase